LLASSLMLVSGAYRHSLLSSPRLPLHPPISAVFPYTTLFRSEHDLVGHRTARDLLKKRFPPFFGQLFGIIDPLNGVFRVEDHRRDRKSTRLNSSHVSISYAVFCLKKKTRTR